MPMFLKHLKRPGCSASGGNGRQIYYWCRISGTPRRWRNAPGRPPIPPPLRRLPERRSNGPVGQPVPPPPRAVAAVNRSTATFSFAAQIIGRAQSVPPIGSSPTVFTASSNPVRAEIGTRVRVEVPPRHMPPYPPDAPVNPTISYAGSTAAVTNKAIAADSSRHESVVPPMNAAAIDPETSRPNRPPFTGGPGAPGRGKSGSAGARSGGR